MLLVMWIVVIATPVAADPITQPTGLNFGDQYRLAFVTSTTGVATSTDIADYNSFVTAAANLEPLLVALGTSWNVIGSTLTVDARDNTGTSPSSVAGGSVGVPIYLVNDTKLADSNDDLWDGSIDLPLNINENGDPYSDFVFTGTFFDGWVQEPPRPLGFNGGAGEGPSAWIGNANSSAGAWMIGGTEEDQARLLPFYAMSEVLTAVPEPGSIILMSIGAIGLNGFGGRRRKRAA
jgi:hypothetical protein